MKTYSGEIIFIHSDGKQYHFVTKTNPLTHNPTKKGILTCSECKGDLREEDAVWIDNETGKAKGPPDGTPFHVACVDKQQRPYPQGMPLMCTPSRYDQELKNEIDAFMATIFG
jgi:hypothetical protein